MTGIQATATRDSERLAWIPAAAALLGTGWGSNQFTPMLLVYRHALGLSTGTLEAMFGLYALGLIPGPLVAGLLAQWAAQPRIIPYVPHLVFMALVLVMLRDVPETVRASERPAVRLSAPGARSPRFRRVVAPMAPWTFAAPAIAFALLP